MKYFLLFLKEFSIIFAIKKAIMMEDSFKKQCICCDKEKSLDQYYSHKKMADGHLNKCKECCKSQSGKREKELRQDPVFVESEKNRARDRYYRLGYKDLHKASPESKKNAISRHNEKFPEKKQARNSICHLKTIVPGNEFHHWSYNEEHFKDVIELSVSDHSLIHRYISYDQEHKKYRTRKGTLLDTKEKHLLYIKLVKQLL